MRRSSIGENWTEAVVYLARKLHWSREQLGELTPAQFNEILSEIAYQESLEEYRKDLRVGAIMAVIINCTPRKGGRTYKATDFCGEPPTRAGVPESVGGIYKLAQKVGIKPPKGE